MHVTGTVISYADSEYLDQTDVLGQCNLCLCC